MAMAMTAICLIGRVGQLARASSRPSALLRTNGASWFHSRLGGAPVWLVEAVSIGPQRSQGERCQVHRSGAFWTFLSFEP